MVKTYAGDVSEGSWLHFRSKLAYLNERASLPSKVSGLPSRVSEPTWKGELAYLER